MTPTLEVAVTLAPFFSIMIGLRKRCFILLRLASLRHRRANAGGSLFIHNFYILLKRWCLWYAMNKHLNSCNVESLMNDHDRLRSPGLHRCHGRTFSRTTQLFTFQGCWPPPESLRWTTRPQTKTSGGERECNGVKSLVKSSLHFLPAFAPPAAYSGSKLVPCPLNMVLLLSC